jgi:hypothetical protein
MRLKTINGRYFPSFFCIKVETNDKPEDFLNQNNLDTVIHEYLHFIQDVSTVYGLANTSNTISDFFIFIILKKLK